MKRIIKNHILGFVVGVILCTGIGSVFALIYIESKNVIYTNEKDSSIQNVEDAVNKLYDNMLNSEVYSCYDGTCGKLSYRYWVGGSYNKNSIPTTTYKSKDDLAATITNFSNNPIYIKSVLIDGNVIGHEVCYRDFCIPPHYCPSQLTPVATYGGVETAYKMSEDLKRTTGISVSCEQMVSSAAGATCSISLGWSQYLHLYAYSNGDVRFGNCSVDRNGTASC